MSQSLSSDEVKQHNTKKDLYLVIHDKVYNTSSFVDEHPYVLRNLPSHKLDRTITLLPPPFVAPH